MVTKATLVFVLLLGLTSAQSDTCYTLSMEGGGTHGAYEAGVVYGLAHLLPPDEVRWNVITGISTGSLNTGQCAHFAYGDEQAMSEYLVETWLLIQNQNMIAPNWPGSTFHSLFFKPSLCDTRPLHAFLESRLGQSIQRNVTVGATNLQTGKFTDFTEAVGIENLATATMCSAAPPLAFPPIQFEGNWFVDGAVSLNIDAFNAIARCRVLGYQDRDITVDLIFDYPKTGLPSFRVNNTNEVLQRASDVSNYFDRYWYVAQIFKSYPRVNFRYVFYPSQPLPPNKPGVPLDFNPTDMTFEVNLGKADAENMINSMQKGLNTKETHGSPPQIHYL